MNILNSACITIAACRLTFALYTIIAGHDPMPPYGGYSGEGVNYRILPTYARITGVVRSCSQAA